MKIVLNTPEFIAIMLDDNENTRLDGENLFVITRFSELPITGKFKELTAILDRSTIGHPQYSGFQRMLADRDMHFKNPMGEEEPDRNDYSFGSGKLAPWTVGIEEFHRDHIKYWTYQNNLLTGPVHIYKKAVPQGNMPEVIVF